MSHKLLPLIVFLEILKAMTASKRCGFSECNYEGECNIEGNLKTCTCFGTKYFTDDKCSTAVDNCQNENPCKNGGECKNVVGQFICENCIDGFGGLWCDLRISNAFQKLLVYFNHRGFYGKEHKFIITVKNLGTMPFSFEFVSDNYAIDSFETIPEQNHKWIYSLNLPEVIKKFGIRYYHDLPYSSGYYHLATETFYDIGLLDLTLYSYDSETAQRLLYENYFKLFVHSRKEECLPSVSFIHGANPLEPLMLNIASYNYFEVVLKKRCFYESEIVYHWYIYDSIGTVKLYYFGSTKDHILKTHPYKLWFNYHGEVMSSYRIVVKMIENGKFIRKTQTRCFILILPKPVFATIKGGNFREVGFNQTLILDASNSRDYALAPDAIQDMFYTWHCTSEDDADNDYCKNNIGSTPIIKIGAGKLKVQNTYNFVLSLNSKINKLVFDEIYQLVKITANLQLNVDIQCLRNCVRNKFIPNNLLHLKALSLDKKLSEAATFKWTLEEQVIGDEMNLVYFTKESDNILKIQVVVTDETLSGKAVKSLELNTPPVNGSCAIDPIIGEAFVTSFHIKCKNYKDVDRPLSYEFIEENGFPLQRTNEPEIITKLPQCNAVVVRVCDLFEACLENNLKVTVKELEQTKILKAIWQKEKGGLKDLLETGDILKAMILLKSITQFPKSIEDTDAIIEEMKSFKIATLLQVEQFLEISRDLVNHNQPLSAKKAYVLKKYLVKLQQGLRIIVQDEEIKAFKKIPYERSCQQLMQIIQYFSQTWQNIPTVQELTPQAVLSSNPLIEAKLELNHFDTKIAEQLRNWLDSTITLLDCYQLMSLGAKKLYAPWEDVFTAENDNFYMQMYAFDNGLQQNIHLNSSKINIILNSACVKELQAIFHRADILVQTASLNSNPFWWYPSENPLSSDVFFLKVLESKSVPAVKYLKNPFQFQLTLKGNTTSPGNEIFGFVRNYTHTPLYTIELPANAVLLTTFLQAERPLKFLIQLCTPAKSLKIHKFGNIVSNTYTNQSFVFRNTLNKKAVAFMGLVLLEEQHETVGYAFQNEIRECLYWDFSLNEPQWSSQDCKPELDLRSMGNLNCFCHHFSAFAARRYPTIVQESLKERYVLKELPVNWYLVIFYSSLTAVFTSILLLNLQQYHKRTRLLVLNPPGLKDNEIEVCLFTGPYYNATSTANISLRLKSHDNSFSLIVYQNPENPFLKRISVLKLLINSQTVDKPLELSISNDLSGRYASWYCHKIIITNLKSLQKQTFLIDKWISEETLENLQPERKQYHFNERFWKHLMKIYINWYQFQSLSGCWLYDDLNRLERSCREVSLLMVTVCLLACYFGCTTLETYEEERLLYKFLNFNILELLLLSITCFIFKFILKFIFNVNIWLLHKMFAKTMRYSKKMA